MDEKVIAALIAGVVSLTVGVISFFATRSKVRSEMTQTQFRDILKKRIEVYPKLWSISIRYETNWTIEDKPKDREWAQQYLEELSAFNVEGGSCGTARQGSPRPGTRFHRPSTSSSPSRIR